MTPATLAQAKVEVLDPGLGHDRVQRLAVFAQAAFLRVMETWTRVTLHGGQRV